MTVSTYFTPVRFAIELGRCFADPGWDRVEANDLSTRLGRSPLAVERAFACYQRWAEEPWRQAWRLWGSNLVFAYRSDDASLDATIAPSQVSLLIGGQFQFLHLCWDVWSGAELSLSDAFVDRALLLRHAGSYGDAVLAEPLLLLLALDNRLDRRISQALYALARRGTLPGSRWEEEAARSPECFGQEAARALAPLLWRWHVKDDELVGGRLRTPTVRAAEAVLAD